MFLNPQMYELLLTLDRAKLKGGDGWVSSNALRHIPINTRTYAQTKGYITGKGNTAKRQYMITSAGRTMLANNADANMAVMDEIENGYVPTGDLIDDLTIVEPAGIIKSLIAVPPSVPQVEQKNIAIAIPQNDPRAQACVRAVAILSEDFPEVNDLVESLMKLQARKAADHD